MTITNADLEGKDWVMTYQIPHVKCAAFERRPVSWPPDEDGIVFMDWGTPLGIRASKAGLYRGGEWLTLKGKPFKDQPTHWTKLVDRRGAEA